MAISKTVIEDIRARCDIVDVVGSFVQLKRSGASSYKGLCPFHNEKTPSFHVDIARQRYHCFGCGKGGDVFGFLMEKENVTFYDAVHMLASRAGVIIPDDDARNGDPEDARQRAGAKERLYRLNEAASEFFCRFLCEHPDSEAAQYLRRRGIPDDVARKFRIGAAPDSWDAFRRFSRTQGFTDEEGVTAGVLHRSENGRVFDQFRNRLVFSIFNEIGRGVGFSARSLEPKPQDGRKYVNTPDTPVFRKGQNMPVNETQAECLKIPVVVGVTGHIDIAQDESWVLGQLEQFWSAVRRIVGPETPIVLLSSLARGDRKSTRLNSSHTT